MAAKRYFFVHNCALRVLALSSVLTRDGFLFRRGKDTTSGRPCDQLVLGCGVINTFLPNTLVMSPHHTEHPHMYA